MPGCMDPLNRTRTDSGMSKGMMPVAAAKATKLISEINTVQVRNVCMHINDTYGMYVCM